MPKFTRNITDPDFIYEFNLQTKGIKKEFLFIDWIRPSKEPSQLLMEQIALIESNIGKIPIIIFNRDSRMEPNEIKYFLDNGVILLEPCINHNQGFLFHPPWIKIKNISLETFNYSREYDIIHKSKDFTIDFEKVALELLSDNSISIGIDCRLPTDKYKSLSSVFNVNKIEYKNSYCSMISGTDRQISLGYIPDFRQCINAGTIPILHDNHKYLHFLFKDLTIYEISDIIWIVNFCRKKMGYGLISTIYDNIEKYLPEMKVENFVSNIIQMAERK